MRSGDFVFSNGSLDVRRKEHLRTWWNAKPCQAILKPFDFA